MAQETRTEDVLSRYFTPEAVKANEALKDLEDDKVNAIVAFALNAGKEAISTKVREIHSGYDNDVKEVLGIERPGDKKTYEWIKTDILPRVKESEQYKQQFETLKVEQEQLKQQIADGKADGISKERMRELEKQLRDKETEISAVRTQKEQEANDWKKKYHEAEKAKANMLVDFEFQKSLIGVKPKPGLTEDEFKVIVDYGKGSLLNDYKPDWDNEKLVFRDATGSIALNPEKGMTPYTAGDLLLSKIKASTDTGYKQTGGGTKPGKDNDPSHGFELNAATQVDADAKITKHLVELGIARGTPAFNAKLKEIRTEHGVEKLPLR